jgi:predicted Ser/Thr protein kinase
MIDTFIRQKHGVSTTDVLLGTHNNSPAIFKYFKTKSKLNREYSAYSLLGSCAFVPAVLEYKEEELLLILEYVGMSLDIKYKPKDRLVYLPDIYKLNEELITTYGIYHNDIRWKNVVENDAGKLYIIDFERWTDYERDPRERSLEKIGR